ncbi:putative cupredoxin-like copper-binding protein [Candidatus Pelagibacter ubique]|uniref:Cupredoxin-like copper-binding protein n=2 Tax=Pelagibacter ubique TaxID=198252 RepID=A0ABX1T593_PELUQ|nr:putative cupredoxin-like copper-binding protein [Candidatus Pelagibacter ubique]
MRLIKIIFIISFINSLAYADKEMKIGSKGNLNDVNRVVKVVMYDNYYEPSSFKIKAGETIKFELVNAGELVHEFNIANKMMHMKHQPQMEKMVENEILFADSIDKNKMKKMAKIDKSMGHSHSNSVLLEPKKKGDIIWKFDNAVNIEIACNVPGHYQVGMIAKVNIN